MKDPNIQLWCEDEAHFQRHSSLIRMWSPKGQQPQVFSASTREKVGFFGALDLKTGRLLTEEASTFDGETFGYFFALPSPVYSRKIAPHPGQRQISQGTNFERVFRSKPGAALSRLLTALFSRAQSDRKGMEDHPPAGYAQSVFRISHRTQDGSCLSFCKMAATEHSP